MLKPASSVEAAARVLMTGLGMAAGFFIVPLQVFLQARPPEDQKGRMIGTMNLINWIGIVFAAAFYQLAIIAIDRFELRDAAGRLEVTWMFAALALLILPVALFYRPGDVELE